jgi:hypothetical protein
MVTGRRRRLEKSESYLGYTYVSGYSFNGRLYVTFIDKEGDEHKIAVSKGDNLLDIAQANDIEMEG